MGSENGYDTPCRNDDKVRHGPLASEVEYIRKEDKLLAIIIPRNYSNDGIIFFTKNEDSQQLAYMKRSRGYQIQRHIHNQVPREVQYTQETLIIRSGLIKIEFYDNNKDFYAARALQEGDIVLLVSGGHGIEMLDDSEIIEVKQGPYAGINDKTRF